MESSMEISMEGSIMKMSTSESEQSLSEKCVSRSSEAAATRSEFFFEQQSDGDVPPCGELHDNGSIHHCPISRVDVDYSDRQSHDSLGSIEEFLADSENHNVSFEKTNYFSLTFTNEDIENLTKTNGDDDDAFQAGTFLNSTVNVGDVEESDTEDKTLVCNVSDLSLKKTSLKLFSPEKVLNAMTRIRCDMVQEKASPMDISSPDSHKSLTEDLTATLGTFSISEESPTRGPVAETRGQPDSLDEISSGEMSDQSVSQNVSEFWEQERYLSEYNYDEPIDKDKERQLMNFGDDYRNFLDSLSESHSSLGGHTIDERRKKSKRLSKKKLVSVRSQRLFQTPRRLIGTNCIFFQPDSARSYDTCSDNDVDDVSNFIADSQRSINSVETRKNNWEEDGFVKEEHLLDYVSLIHVRECKYYIVSPQNELMGICSENLKTIVDVLRTKDLQETFVSKKKSREMRCKWEIKKLLLNQPYFSLAQQVGAPSQQDQGECPADGRVRRPQEGRDVLPARPHEPVRSDRGARAHGGR
jgi:hypothetical protein